MNKIKTYTAIDFQQYHARTMPAKDMHALERAALEDPFLADALEGYEHTVNAAVEIEKIKEKLPPYKEEEKIAAVAFNKKLWMRVAASVALFIGLGVLFFNINNNTNKPLAINETTKQNNIDSIKIALGDSALTLELNAVSEGNIAQNTLKGTTDVVIQMEALKLPSGNYTTNEATTVYNYTTAPSTTTKNEGESAPTVIEMKDQANGKLEFAKFDDVKADSINYRQEVVKNLRKDAAVDNDAFANNGRLFNNNAIQNGFYNSYNFSGVVKTPAGGPMQNATIKMRNSNLITKTDNNGRFNFVATDSVAVVSVIAAGYANKDLKLNGFGVTIPVATNSTAANMNEVVVVTGSSALAKKKSQSYDVAKVSKEELEKATPVDLTKGLSGKVSGLNVETKENEKPAGLINTVKQIKIDSTAYKTSVKNFNAYVLKNIIPQFDEKGNEYKGKVILSFTTNKKGAPRKIKTEKSLNKKCDAHAKKLLESGPSWQIKTLEKNTVTIQF